MRLPAPPRLALGLCLGMLLPSPLLAQRAFWATCEDGELARVVHYRGGQFEVEREGARVSVEGSDCQVGAAFEYAEGHVLANKPDLALYESRKRFDFLFRMLVLPSRDYDNAYAVVELGAVGKGRIYLPQSLPSLKAGQPRWIHCRGSANIDLDPDVFHVYLFSNGEELYQVPTELKLKGKKQPPVPVSARARSSQDPELVAPATKPVPPRLVAEIANEGASFVFAVADSGYGFDFQALDAYSLAMERTGIDLLKSSRFSPGAEGGFFQVKQLVVRIDFDERGRYRFSTLGDDAELSYN